MTVAGGGGTSATANSAVCSADICGGSAAGCGWSGGTSARHSIQPVSRQLCGFCQADVYLQLHFV
jgi:hypothetical protein